MDNHPSTSTSSSFHRGPGETETVSAHGGLAECRLLRLPLELRQRIYTLVMGPRRLVDLLLVRIKFDTVYNARYRCRDSPQSEPKLDESGAAAAHKCGTGGILRVSRAISNEALDILYGENVFFVNIHADCSLDLRRVGIANVQRIRHLRILARGPPPTGMAYGRRLEGILDPQLWLPLFKDLKELCIVAQQPLPSSSSPSSFPSYVYDDDDDDGAATPTATLEHDLVEWKTWLDPILRFISTNLTTTTTTAAATTAAAATTTATVSVDHDGRAETKAMMDAHFGALGPFARGQGYRHVRTVTGDFCFERGRYSRASGYWDTNSRWEQTGGDDHDHDHDHALSQDDVCPFDLT